MCLIRISPVDAMIRRISLGPMFLVCSKSWWVGPCVVPGGVSWPVLCSVMGHFMTRCGADARAVPQSQGFAGFMGVGSIAVRLLRNFAITVAKRQYRLLVAGKGRRIAPGAGADVVHCSIIFWCGQVRNKLIEVWAP